MMRTRWIPGPAADTEGPVLVSVTEFTGDAFRDVPAIYRAGLELSRAWPRLDGAVGTWLWARPLGRASGSVSVWEDEAALRRFVSWAPHVAIVRRFRDRGRVRATTWHADRFAGDEAWREAVRFLEDRTASAPV
ncbi:hypothetical protein [Actinomadura kijaniata]|uniref:hypothetical protein n=1 Tax=Actinomadura kijaniata TaxID=46161 RepID=UPI000831D318|nr:hypothetical protein [Actinomadura kijaniata]